MSLKLRPATAEDRPVLLDLWEEAWTAAMPSIDFAARRPWFAGHLQAMVDAGTQVIVAHDGEAILGFVTVDPGTELLDQLAVATHGQGRGVASSLLDAVKRVSPEGVRLSVNVANGRAIALYRRHGFEVVGEDVNARSGLPVLHMRWRP